MSKKKVLDIGQCDFDHSQIKALLESLGCQVLREHTAEQGMLALVMEGADLVLINRIFDRDGGSGLDLISKIKGSNPALAAIPLMLVSNYEEAQKQAVEKGALQGFGKANINATTTKELIKKALG